MEKEEKLQEAKRLYETANADQRYVLESLFPELQESEDEKIRKALITFFNRFPYDSIEAAGTNAKEAIAWLEKQGEPAKLSEEEQNKFAKGVLTSCALSFIDYLDAHKYEGKMCVSNGECEDIENAFHNAMWDRLHRYYCKYIEKQGEQKPTDKCEGCNNAKGCVACVDGSEWAHIEEHNPAWSEEDEEMVEGLVNCLAELEQETGWNYVYVVGKSVELNKVRKWVKSLKERVQPQPQQELNEDTQQWIDAIIKDYEEWYKVNKDHRATIQIEIDILKSLKERYTWKPSDEQINALARNVEYVNVSCTQPILKGLLEDLMKL